MFVLLCNVPVLVTATTPAAQVAAITDVYNALGVSHGGGDPCTNPWTGITCNTQDDIIKMYPIIHKSH